MGRRGRGRRRDPAPRAARVAPRRLAPGRGRAGRRRDPGAGTATRGSTPWPTPSSAWPRTTDPAVPDPRREHRLRGRRGRRLRRRHRHATGTPVARPRRRPRGERRPPDPDRYARPRRGDDDDWDGVRQAADSVLNTTSSGRDGPDGRHLGRGRGPRRHRVRAAGSAGERRAVDLGPAEPERTIELTSPSLPRDPDGLAALCRRDRRSRLRRLRTRPDARGDRGSVRACGDRPSNDSRPASPRRADDRRPARRSAPRSGSRLDPRGRGPVRHATWSAFATPTAGRISPRYRAPVVPAAFAGTVDGVLGLDGASALRPAFGWRAPTGQPAVSGPLPLPGSGSGRPTWPPRTTCATPQGGPRRHRPDRRDRLLRCDRRRDDRRLRPRDRAQRQQGDPRLGQRWHEAGRRLVRGRPRHRGHPLRRAEGPDHQLRGAERRDALRRRHR